MTRQKLRRHAALVLCAVLAFGTGMAVERARSQTRPRMWADVLVDLTTRDIPRPTRVHAKLDRWEPGAETGRHTHPGPTVFILLEGELEETLADGRTHVLKAGQGFWKPARTEHNVKNTSSRPARAVAVHLDPTG